MAITNHNFYNLNSTRSYPLDDRATGLDDAGRRVPNDILVDAYILVPAIAGSYFYLSSLTVTSRLVSATILACTTPESIGTFVPIASLSLTKPINAYRHYPLEAMYPGVGGWLVFGDTDEEVQARFSTPLQGLLAPRIARTYRGLPVTGLNKRYNASTLTGVVLFKAGNDIDISAGTRLLNGIDRTCVVMGLKSFSHNRNVLDIYRGPCGGRPESGTCQKAGLEFINTVAPDCNGNLTLEFQGVMEVGTNASGVGSIIVDYPLGLTDACIRKDRLPDEHGTLPNTYDDTCTSLFEGPTPGGGDDTGELPPHESISSISFSSSSMPCPGFPYSETFADSVADNFKVLTGTFAIVSYDDPDSMTTYPVYEAVDIFRRNLAIWNQCGDRSTVNLRCAVEASTLKESGGELLPTQNAAMVINYHTVHLPFTHDEYFLAEIDINTDALRLLLWNGTAYVLQAAASGLGLHKGHFYRIEVEVTPGPSPSTQSIIMVTLRDTDPPYPVLANFAVTTTRYLPDYGRFGLASNNARSIFRFFSMSRL